MYDYDAIIIGAGPSGLMCGMRAAERGRRVLILDKGREPGRKLLISGGGKCNFTNLEMGPEFFVTSTPPFARSALSRYSQWDFISLISSAGIGWEERDHGQLFCLESARQIRDLLVASCAGAGCRILTGVEVQALERAADSDISGMGYILRTSAGSFNSERVVMAAGGLSIPPLGVSPIGFETARQFGLEVIKPRAGLVPLTLHPPDKSLFAPLSGISLWVRVTCGRKSFLEQLLFTHRGLSGPAILQISSYWKAGEPLTIDLIPGTALESILGEPGSGRSRKQVKSLLSEHLPRRLIAAFLPEALAGVAIADLTQGHLKAIGERLSEWKVKPAGTEGFRTAEVTLGGVDCRELDPRSMEAKKAPGLHFIGENIDMTGHLGGYNLQWAWSSGWCCGQAL